MNIDFETFLEEINTADDNDNNYYNENFENFLDRLFTMVGNNNDNPEDFYVFGGDDDEEDNLLEMIEDATEQEADGGPIEAQ